MTEYEAATLAFRTASLWATYGQIAATLAIGIGQIGIVWYGIRAMNRASAVRTADRASAERAAERRERAADQRHDEAMQVLDMQRQALETLIARTAPATSAGD